MKTPFPHPQAADPYAVDTPPREVAVRTERAYDATFWGCYAANFCLVVTFSLMFRYADFITYLGGSEMDLGLIVGAGMIGALAIRAAQGVGIDRYGPRRIWLFSLALCSVSMLAHLAVTQVDGVGVYLARMLYTTGIAGAFGSSIAYITLRAPRGRMAEMIGILGTSGFIGFALGPILGDFLFPEGEIGRAQIQRLFLLAAASSFASFLLVAVSTRKSVGSGLRKRPPVVALLRRYHPGAILLVGVGIGIAIGLPHTFLRAYAAELEIPRIKTFFVVYAIVAFSVRISPRRLTDRIGVRPVILWGLAAVTISMLSYLSVGNEWSLAIPAVFAGVAHAFLLPAVLTGSNAAFPSRYRGIATTLMLTMFDIGSLIGQPAVGGIIRAARELDLPPYPIMFLAVAATMVVIALVYCQRTRCAISAAQPGDRPQPNRATHSRRRRRAAAGLLQPPALQAEEECVQRRAGEL